MTRTNNASLPSFRTYGKYSSDNYGAHALRFDLPDGREIYFSYKTPVAFRAPGVGLIVRENDWGPTTGKHLNAICTDKKSRVPGERFESMLAQHFGAVQS